MKKTILILASAVLALAACNKVDIIEENHGDAITFRPFTSTLTRVATTQDVTTANIASFKVTAFNAGTTANPYINDITYSRTTATPYVFYVDPTAAASSDYRNEYYWPANNLDFYAYSWTDGSSSTYFSGSQVAKTAYNTFTYTPAVATSSADPDHADLVVACVPNASKASYGANGIPLNFRHAASKIVVKVKNTSAQLKFDIDAWKVGYLYEKGTYTLPKTSTATHYDDNASSPTLLNLSDWAYTGATQVVGHEYVSNQSSMVYVNPNTTTAVALDGEMILVPQTHKVIDMTATDKKGYASTDPGAALDGAFIAVKFIIRNNDAFTAGTDPETSEPISTPTDGQGTVIYGTAPVAPATAYTTGWAIWPLPASSVWEPGKKYTYTIDLAGGGYYETNQAETESGADQDELDPILDNTVIKFITVTVDEWQTQAEIAISGPTNL